MTAVPALFFYGTLCHLPLLRAVLGREVQVVAAQLPDHGVWWSAEGAWPVIRAQAGAVAQGILLRDAGPEDLDRLDFYEGAFGYDTRVLPVQTVGGLVPAQVYFPVDAAKTGAPWHLPDWVADWGAVAVATAPDVMALRGQRDAAEVARRYRLMLVRGASRVRAATPAPVSLRHAARAEDVVIARQTQPYANFFAIEEYDLHYRRFDGTMSPRINRAVFLSGDAVTVLPYDPQRDRVLLIEQFRAGPHGRGDPQPWLLEAIAGRVDPEEAPEQAARREAVEEAGLVLGDLEKVGQYYPSPGAKSEYLYSYVALCDLPDGVEGVFGEASEAEDIRGHLVDFDRFMQLVTTGEVDNAPLLITALWLQRERARLRGGHSPA
ncbi:NUDIX domain-containing protein [Gemmobacter fulvus]|uniref:NUDIX domain-containing protein n=1 Tax=Gemmobacter fulvus TaxID=2840474 RepID=UPI002796A399|nr:NUDIX domain-containing protein [Gemmobacter fulvus]MDQ1849293.1 NUDIX domain-containing protein [Gemmobacter fulvus]